MNLTPPTSYPYTAPYGKLTNKELPRPLNSRVLLQWTPNRGTPTFELNPYLPQLVLPQAYLLLKWKLLNIVGQHSKPKMLKSLMYGGPPPQRKSNGDALCWNPPRIKIQETTPFRSKGKCLCFKKLHINNARNRKAELIMTKKDVK